MRSTGKDNLVEGILTSADKLFRQLFPTVPKDLLTLDVTMPQMKIMFMLYIHGPLRMSLIASQLDVTLPTATSLVDRLVEKKYIVRENQTDDRRVVLCRLAENGQKAIGRIWETSRIRLEEILGAMDTAKLQMLNEVLADMLKSSNNQVEAYLKTSQSQNKA